MKFKKYESVKEAISSVLKKDTEYRFLVHDFPKSKLVQKHKHPDTHEWVIVDGGEFELYYQDKWLLVKPEEDKTVVVSIPPETVHGLKVKKAALYIVIRDKEAKTEYIKQD